MNPFDWILNKLSGKQTYTLSDLLLKRVVSGVSKVDTTKKSEPKNTHITAIIPSISAGVNISSKYEITTSGKVDPDSSTWARPNNSLTRSRVDRLRKIVDAEE